MIWIFVNECAGRKDANVTYFSGYSPEFCVVAYDSISKKKCMFVIPFEKGIYKGIKNISFSVKTFKKDIKSYFRIKRLDKIGINFSSVSVLFKKKISKILDVKFSDISKDVLHMRLNKSKEEINKISKACKYTVNIFDSLVAELKSDIKLKSDSKLFKTERDIEIFIKKKAIDLGVGLSFEPSIGTNVNSANPHNTPSNKKLKGFTVIDFGLIYQGYCSDMTRTIYFGKPTSNELESYNLVMKSYDASLNKIKLNGLLSNIDLASRKILGKKLVHAVGHGVGIDIHESPSVSPKSKNKISNGIVFTIEPGIYFKGKYGIRFENTLVFDSNKYKIGYKELTASSRELYIF